MKEAAEKGAEIALFGELFLTENNPSNLCELETYLKSCGGSVAVVIQKAAKELGIAVIYGYPEVENGRHYNSLMFVNKRGEQLANYRKVHLWPSEKELYTPGNAVAVVDWDGLRVGLSIGIDICVAEFFGTMVRSQWRSPADRARQFGTKRKVPERNGAGEGARKWLLHRPRGSGGRFAPWYVTRL